MTPFVAEILGTGILILLGGGNVANDILKKPRGMEVAGLVLLPPGDSRYLRELWLPVHIVAPIWLGE